MLLSADSCVRGPGCQGNAKKQFYRYALELHTKHYEQLRKVQHHSGKPVNPDKFLITAVPTTCAILLHTVVYTRHRVTWCEMPLTSVGKVTNVLRGLKRN